MMARWVPWILVLAAIGSCRPGGKQPPADVLSEARKQLEARGRADQAIREGFGAGGRLDPARLQTMVRTDSANIAWLKAYVAEWGWPTSVQVGHDAVRAAFLIVQHAVQDTAFMRAMLPAIEDAQRRGDLSGSDLAALIDRVEVKAGRRQIYGTQLTLRNGRWEFDPIADSAHVDARRRKLGLPPLAEYRRLVDSMLKAP